MDPVGEKIEQARRDLLDLGLKNTLLNYRELRSKGVRIIGERPEEVFRILVEEGRSLSFLPAPQASSETLDANVPQGLASILEEEIRKDEEDRTATRYKDGKLQTPYSADQLQYRLLNTYYATRTALEEQGINMLFLALGMLEWYEDESSDLLHRAPLILVPVSLSRESVRARFKMEYTGDEIDTNLSLQTKLKAEYGIDLPTLLEEEAIIVQDYFERVASAVAGLPRWRVDRETVVLGFFSFSKLLMFKDLDPANWPENWKPSQHSVLRALLYEGFHKWEPVIGENENLDRKIDSTELHQVCDADSSQTVALIEVKNGRNLVIQGPPGTGKSQTITNLIAEALASGNTVLFVAEKMAALEVVKRRLDALGLGDACLELHSHKTNKKAVLGELKRTLELGRPRHEGRDQSAEGLRQARERLNQYCQALHTPIGKSNVTPYHAYGILLRLEERLKKEHVSLVDAIELPEWPESEYAARRSLAEELQSFLGKIGIPKKHPFWGSSSTVYLPSDRRIEEKSQIARQCLEAVRHAADRLTAIFKVEACSDLAMLKRWAHTARHALEAPDLSEVEVKRSEWNTERKTFHRIFSVGRRIQELHAHFDSRLLPEAWASDIVEVRKDLAIYGPKWWRFLSKKYRQARRTILSLYRIDPPRSPEDLLETADAILYVQQGNRDLEESGKLMAELFGSLWNGWRSDWDILESVTAYLAVTHEKLNCAELQAELLDYLGQAKGHAALQEAVIKVEVALEAYFQAVKAAVEAVEFDAATQFGDGGFSSVPFDLQDTLLRTWEENADRLQDIVSWNHLADRMRNQELAQLVEIAAAWELAGEHLVALLDYIRYSRLIKKAMRERPELASFDGERHEHVVQRFQDLDKRLLELNRAYLAQKHWESLPSGTNGQMAVLKREFEKMRRHRPIRRLMLDAGQAIQTIKPIFLMSPLSVATYVPPGSVKFDVVIFDEASQVRPADALGAILRGEQAVVVGDSRQLPPTSFFDKVVSTEQEQEEDWDARTSDLESILGLFVAQGAPEVMLRWHYRSHHHSLITVSNHEFYDNKLVVFPAPDNARQDLGLIFRYLPDTVYERGKAVNRGEAQIVARSVMEHARTHPDLTLGVASFSITQMQAIQDELEILRHQDPSCESFFVAHPEEPFFVKNLENVQGDERDVIFISVGYGRTREGYPSMNFGPLNQDGGDRRLNVLITRARRQCVVFSNLRADDIDLSRTNARGVVALKAFLKYAETGNLDVPQPRGEGAESPFEEAVARRLRELGFEVHHQVGSAGFRVDLAVVDPEHPGHYLLGIECDGAAYHSARWARDRDRLRQQILESLGWRIHRIWSTDWFRNSEQELRRVVESIEKAKVGRHTDRRPPPTCMEEGLSPAGLQVSLEDNDHFEDNNKIKREPAQTSRGIVKVPTYRMASPAIHLVGLQLHEVPKTKLAAWIEEVVKIESPVHLLEVAARIAGAAGNQRVGHRILRAIEDGTSLAVNKGRVRRRGDFLWRPDMATAPVRDRSHLPYVSRQIERIPPEELAEAIILVVMGSVGVIQQEAIVEACRLLGYERVTDNIRERVEQVIQSLLTEQRLRLHNGFLILP